MQFPFILISRLNETDVVVFKFVYHIRIYHECEGRIEISVPRIAVWYHEACRVMTSGDPEGRIFVSIMDSFSCSSLFLFIYIIYLFIYLFIYLLFLYLFENKLPEIPEYAMMQFHMMTLLDAKGKIAWVRKIFYPRVESQISLSSVQEFSFSYSQESVFQIIKFALSFKSYIHNFMLFCRPLIFSKSSFSKYSFRNSIRVSNSADPDQV